MIEKNPQHEWHAGGMSMFLLFGRVIECGSFEEFLTCEQNDTRDKERLWRVIKLFSLMPLLEHLLIDTMRTRFKNSDLEEQEHKRFEIVCAIARKTRKTCSSVNKKLKKELSGFGQENILTTPVLTQCIAKLTFGDLIEFFQSHFSVEGEEEFIRKLRKINKCRNYIVHKVTSSRNNIDKELDDGLKVGVELLKAGSD